MNVRGKKINLTYMLLMNDTCWLASAQTDAQIIQMCAKHSNETAQLRKFTRTG